MNYPRHGHRRERALESPDAPYGPRKTDPETGTHMGQRTSVPKKVDRTAIYARTGAKILLVVIARFSP